MGVGGSPQLPQHAHQHQPQHLPASLPGGGSYLVAHCQGNAVADTMTRWIDLSLDQFAHVDLWAFEQCTWWRGGCCRWVGCHSYP